MAHVKAGNAQSTLVNLDEFSYFKLMRDGSKMIQFDAKKLCDGYHYTKENGRWALIHDETGALVTTARTLKLLKELVQEPEFFEPFDLLKICTAVNRWGNRHFWDV